MAKGRRTQPAQEDADQAEHDDRADERRPHRQRGIETVGFVPEDGRDDRQQYTVADNSFRRESCYDSAEGTNKRGADEMQRKKRHGCESEEERNGELEAQRATEGDDPAGADQGDADCGPRCAALRVLNHAAHQRPFLLGLVCWYEAQDGDVEA